MESAKGRNHVRDVLIGLAAAWFVYQTAFRSSASDSSRPVWQSDDDGFETLTNEAEGLETLANADVDVDEGECLETKMFEMWNKEAEAEKDFLRADTAEVHEGEPEHPADIEHRLEELAANASARHAAHLEHAAHLRRDARMHMAKEAREARALKAQHTKWDEQAKDKMADLKRQLCADPARKEYPMCKEAPETHAGDAADVARHQAEFASEMREIQARHDEWDHAAKDQWRELRHKLCADPSHHRLHMCQHVHGPTSEETHAELDQRMHQLHDQHEAWDHRAHDEIASLKAELCTDPARRGYAACAGEEHARIDDHAHALHAKHHEWDEHARDEIHALMDELCADPARKDYAACAKQTADVQREPQWSDVQARLQSQYDSATAVQQRAASARQAEFDRLEGDTKATLNSEPEVTGWAQELIGSQARMRERLEQLHAGHQAAASKSRGFMAKEGEQTSSWAKGLMDMQAKMQYQLEHLHDDHHHHHAEGAAAPRSPVSSSWSQGLLNMQAEMQSQLDHLHDHHQRHGHSATQDKSSEPSAWAQNLMDMQAKMQYQLDHLHDHMHSHHHHGSAAPATAAFRSSSKLRGAQRAASPAVQSSGSPPADALEWRTAKSWKGRVPDYGSKAALFDREWLHSTEWKSEAPNVTCIMALPATETQHLHLMYAVNNFKLVAQHYQGASELVVVYHHNDEEGAKLVRKYTEEGSNVRGVASRDDAVSFPTTMAFRYAAWTSKSQVIAQWDFETYYHPDRLNMQVRALASSDRPASLMLSADGARGAAGARGLEGTLAGEAGWMKQHWHPQQSEESGVLELAQAHNIVLVDSPAILYGATTTTSHDNRESKMTQS